MSFGKTVAVTGGGTGIGRATAKAFLEQGARAVLNGRRAEVLDATARELDHPVTRPRGRGRHRTE